MDIRFNKAVQRALSLSMGIPKPSPFSFRIIDKRESDFEQATQWLFLRRTRNRPLTRFWQIKAHVFPLEEFPHRVETRDSQVAVKRRGTRNQYLISFVQEAVQTSLSRAWPSF